MNIKKCTVNELDSAVTFVFKINSIKGNRGRPFLNNESFEVLKSGYLKNIENEFAEVLLIYNEDLLVGVTAIDWIPKDRYLAITKGLFVEGNYSDVAKSLLSYLKTRFSGFSLYTNCAKECTMALEFYTHEGFTKLEEAELYRLYDFNSVSESKNIEHLTDKNSDELWNLLSSNIDENTYWNRERVEANLREFIVLCHRGNNIDGALYARIYKSNIVEIFNTVTFNKDVTEQLFKELIIQCKKISAKLLILYTDDKMEIEVGQTLGFIFYDSNVCYMKVI